MHDLFGILDELERCRNGLVETNHRFGQAIDRLSETRRTWESVESEAARAVRKDAPKAATATEIKGLITAYVNIRPSSAAARAEYDAAKDDLTKIESEISTFHHIIKTLQTAKGIHEQLLQGGGA